MRTVEIPVIKSDSDLDEALKRLEAMMERDDPAEDDEAYALMAMVKAYENRHYPVGYPGPVEAIKFVMEQRGLSNKDLAKLLGAQPRVSEIMNGKRPLTLSMIRRLNEEWDIPLDLLIKPAANPEASAIPSSLRLGS